MKSVGYENWFCQSTANDWELANEFLDYVTKVPKIANQKLTVNDRDPNETK